MKDIARKMGRDDWKKGKGTDLERAAVVTQYRGERRNEMVK